MRYAGFIVAVVLLAVAPGTAKAEDKAKTIQGKVTSVAADSVTVANGSESMTFGVDSTTKIIGKGLTTKTNEKAVKGEKLTLTDAVGSDDRVSVTYMEAGGKLHATTIKVTQKALTAK